MTQPVTAPGSSELASKLEELLGLASQIAHRSNELRATPQSDLLANSTSACTLFHVALLNAEGCLSLLQSINQAPIHPPPTSPFAPSVNGASRSPTPVPLDASLTNLSPPSWRSPPATQRWPYPPIFSLSSEVIFKPPTHASPGDRSANECSPSPPLFNQPQTRRGVSIAELVDEENSSPGTRGGTNHPSRPAAMHVNVPTACIYPMLSISIVDVTPPPTRGPEGPEASGVVPRRPKRKTESLTTSEATGQRVTRSITKRKATKEPEIEATPSKRAKFVHPHD